MDLNQLTILSDQSHISELIAQAHKVILASSSPSSENLWKWNNDPHPLIYMREIADKQITEMLAHQRGRSSFKATHFFEHILGGSTQMSLFWTLFWVNHSQEHPFSAPFWTLELFWTLFRGLKSWFALKNVFFSGFALSTAFLSAQTTYMALLAPLIWEICQFWVFFAKMPSFRKSAKMSVF